MFDSPAASNSLPRVGYFCAACKRRHDGRPFGSVGASLEYCEPAIAHLVASGVIAKDADHATGPSHYGLVRRDG